MPPRDLLVCLPGLALAASVAASAGCGAAETPSDGIDLSSPTATTAAIPTARRTRRPPPPKKQTYVECVAELRATARVVATPDGADDGYERAYTAERSGERDNARKLYLKLLQEQPRSAYVPPAYFAFGWMFGEDARSDPSKWAFCEQAYKEVLKYPDTRVGLVARVELGRTFAQMGDVEQARRELRDALSEATTASRDECGPQAIEEIAVIVAGLPSDG